MRKFYAILRDNQTIVGNSKEQGSKREKTWKDIIVSSGVPSHSGFSFEFLSSADAFRLALDWSDSKKVKI